MALAAIAMIASAGCLSRGRGAGGGGRGGTDRCGDGRIGGEEQCDDGNTASGDGCSASCLTEPDGCGDGTCDMEGGESCTNCAPDCSGEAACAAVCGDGRHDDGEQCDDGNLESGDGCSAVCTNEDEPDPCGDGTCDMEGGEGCESCALDCSSHPACIPMSCGDGSTGAGEECDDGGESETCDVNCTRASCGDRTTNFTAGEQCDSGTGSAECDVDCTVVECGDSVVNAFASETCDDGGSSSGDGCSASCGVEPGWRCAGGSCTPVCGDGILLEIELCDDANTFSGDGCNGSCLIEEGWSCEGSPSACRRGVVRGGLVVTEIMADPTMVTDTNGEWFEVYNASGASLDLLGLTFTDGSIESFTVASSVLVPAGGRAVLGRNASPTINGGLRVDYAYGTAFNLSNTTDVIEIRNGTTQIDRVAYDSAFRIVAGRAGALNAIAHDSSSNDLGSNWCSATATYGMGDYGTPGMENPTCGGGGGMTYHFPRSPGLAIPDNNLTGITDSVSASAFGCVISSVTVDMRITHPYVGDLDVTLTSPGGTIVTLHDNTGGDADNIYGTYPTTLTVDDPAGLGAFAGGSGNGTWRLNVADEASADLGRLDSWGLHITCL